MTDERFKKIMCDLGMPNSRSLLQALRQVANETEQEVRASFACASGWQPRQQGGSALPPPKRP